MRSRFFQLNPRLTPPMSFNIRVVFSTYSSFSTFLTVILYSLRSYEPQVSFSSIDSKFLRIALLFFWLRMIFGVTLYFLSNVNFVVAFSSFVFNFVSSFSNFSFCISIFEFSKDVGVVFFLLLYPAPSFPIRKGSFTFSVRKRSYLILQFWV